MTYQNQFIAVIKSNGKILREENSQVAIPFGSEYSIFLKNLKSVRALVEITIDGESATGGKKIIMNPNSTLDFERYIRDGNLSSGNKFKFIEMTENIEKYRGNKIDDGIIKVEFWAEKVTNNYWPYFQNMKSDYPEPFITRTPKNGDISYGSRKTDYSILRGSTMKSVTTQNMCMPVNTSGITVAGSESKQKFVSGEWFDTELTSTVITFQLTGKLHNEPVSKPITVQTKPKCVTCGRVNKAVNKFCSECGTSLILF